MLTDRVRKIGLGILFSGILIVGLMAGCGGSATTVTKTVAGGGSGTTQTVTTTVSGGGGGGAMSNLVIYGDMATNVGCLSISIAHRGELVVWRNRVVDPVTGKDMTDKDLKTVTALLPDGTKLAEVYGGHPGGGTPTDYFWSVGWEVPLNFPTGSLGYEVQAVGNDGRTGDFKPFEVASSKLNIGAFDPAYVRSWTVNITATGFNVATLSITAGAKVTFSNKDTIPHKVVGTGWDSGDIAATKTYAYVFATAGTYVVKDAANPAYTVTVTVNAIS